VDGKSIQAATVSVPATRPASAKPAPSPRPASSSTVDSGAVLGSGKQTHHAEPAPRPVNTAMRRTNVKFVVDPETNDVSLHVYNAATNELIRQIPSARLAEIAREQLSATGSMVDQSA
jgi:hypothetical protein